MTPADYGRELAATTPPLPDHAIDAAARLYAAWLTAADQTTRPHLPEAG